MSDSNGSSVTNKSDENSGSCDEQEEEGEEEEEQSLTESNLDENERNLEEKQFESLTEGSTPRDAENPGVQDEEVEDVQYHETEENRALREAMERMISTAVPYESEQTEEEIIVLAPSHPMLQSFHRAVTTHLKKQKSRILDDIRELSAKIKASRNEADNDAETLYGLQQTLHRQQSQIGVKSDNLATTTETRQELEKRVQELKAQHKVETDVLHKAQVVEENLWRKLNEHMEKEHEARKRKEEQEMQVAVVRRATEKAHADKKQLAEEKRKQDEFVYRLTCEVSELQARLLQLDAQLLAKSKERTRLEQATAAAAEDLEEQACKQQKLMQAWQRLLISAQAKDVAHNKLLAQKTAVEEEDRALDVKIEGYKRGGATEMEHNEHLTLCMRRLEGDKRQVEKQLKQEKAAIEEEQVQLDGLNTMLKLTEDDLNKAVAVYRKREQQRQALDKEISQLNREQLNLEDKILDALNQQATQDKAVYHTIKRVDKLNLSMEEVDAQKAQKESALAATSLEVQQRRFQEACGAQLVAQEETKVARAQQELMMCEHELKQTQNSLAAKQSALDRINTKLNQILEKTGGKEISIPDLRIQELEAKIQTLTKESEVMQKQFLRKEVALLEQTEAYNVQKKEIEVTQKHKVLLQHKALTQKHVLEEGNHQEGNNHRKMKSELHNLSMVDKEHSRLKEIKSELDKENILTYNDIMAARREEEQEIERLQTNLEELEEEKKRLQDVLREHQSEQVDMEAKVALAAETKQAVEKERSSQGEIAALKSEIHRMEVRLGQLRRAQERLTQDLEQCVLRRDAMVDTARARNMRQPSSQLSRASTQRKLENLRYSNNQTKSKIQKLHKGVTTIETEVGEIENELEKKVDQLKRLQDAFYEREKKLDLYGSKKKQNLEQLVHEQRRGRALSDAKEGRYKPSCRSETALETEAQRQRVTRANLLSVVESLRPDFPSLSRELISISGLLKTIKLHYSTCTPIDENSSTQPEP